MKNILKQKLSHLFFWMGEGAFWIHEELMYLSIVFDLQEEVWTRDMEDIF